MDLTWDQLQVVASSMISYRAFQINTVLDIVAGALGGKKDGKAKPNKGRKKKDKASLETQLSALGMDVTNATGSSS